ncbi:MAG: hypothetical protein ACI4WT_09240 [Oligosphaeraceae bacterium]
MTDPEHSDLNPTPRRRRTALPLGRIILWTLIVTLTAACLWLWWAMGKVYDQFQRQQRQKHPPTTTEPAKK